MNIYGETNEGQSLVRHMDIIRTSPVKSGLKYNLRDFVKID